MAENSEKGKQELGAEVVVKHEEEFGAEVVVKHEEESEQEELEQEELEQEKLEEPELIVELEMEPEQDDAEEIQRMLARRKAFHRKVLAFLMMMLLILTYSVFRGTWWR